MPESPNINQISPRRMGFIFFIISGAMAKWFIYDPLHGQREVLVYWKLVALPIILSVIGLIMIISPEKYKEWITINPQRIGWKQGIVYMSMVVIFMIVHFLISSRMKII
jgi:cell division protein FtsW (lipid II flippase)